MLPLMRIGNMPIGKKERTESLRLRCWFAVGTGSIRGQVVVEERVTKGL